MVVLVVGGGGYIGSHMNKTLARAGHVGVTFDNFSTGYRDAVKYGKVFSGDLQDRTSLDEVFSAFSFDAVMHFASFIQVGESVREPAKYYRNNVANTLNLLEAMLHHRVDKFIFSSTAAIFGEPDYAPIDEKHVKRPVNPYGRSKLMVEEVLRDFDLAYGLKSTCLRYFNAAGADPAGELGERHEPETHLIPLVLQVASGRRAQVTVFGDDYATPDGTCIRDYIHVADLCDAHLLALERLSRGNESAAYNLGNGNGYSVNDVIAVARQVTQRTIPVVTSARRPGDPARLVADSGLARRELGWNPKFPQLEQIVSHAWAWEKGQC